MREEINEGYRVSFIVLAALICSVFIFTSVNADWVNGSIDYCQYQMEFSYPNGVDNAHAVNASVGQTLSVKFYDLTGGMYTNTFYDGGLYSCSNSGGCPFEKSYQIPESANQTIKYFTLRCNGVQNFGFVNVTGIIQVPPSASFTVDPVSGTGYPNQNITFTDTSQYSPTTWSWDFGDTGTSTEQNPVHQYVSAGTYNVSLTVSNAYGQDSTYQSYEVIPYVAPVCSFTASLNNGTSPLSVQFTDTSSNVPTSFFWNFDPEAIGGLSVIPSSINTTENPYVTFSGSGNFPILHTATNPAGTSNCGPYYINLSGPAPEPTPTPGIPFPNQTGVCLGSDISVGSGYNLAYNAYGVLSYPNGGFRNSFYPANTKRIDIGDTLQLGQYFYNEYNESNNLEFRMSYITQECNFTTPSPTPTITATVTSTFPVYPTVTFLIPTAQPTFPLSNNTGLPTFQNISTVPTQLPDVPSAANSSSWRDQICAVPYAGVIYCPVTDVVTGILTTLNSLMFFFIQFAMSPFSIIVSMINLFYQLFFGILGAFSLQIGIITSVLGQVVDYLPEKVKTVVSFIMLKDLIITIFEMWVGEL